MPHVPDAEVFCERSVVVKEIVEGFEKIESGWVLLSWVHFKPHPLEVTNGFGVASDVFVGGGCLSEGVEAKEECRET